MTTSSKCEHKKQFPMPDSLATVCEECGHVFISGQPWDYKSGHVSEWLNDIYGGATSQSGTNDEY